MTAMKRVMAMRLHRRHATDFELKACQRDARANSARQTESKEREVPEYHLSHIMLQGKAAGMRPSSSVIWSLRHLTADPRVG